jgi:hypothetical protein
MRLTTQDSTRLSPDELQSVMQDAIARHGAAERQAEAAQELRTLSSVEEAMEIARQLDIPEEHVRAALRQRERELLRPQRREQAARKRRGEFIFSLVVSIALTAAMGLIGALGSILGLAVLAIWILPLMLGLRLLTAVSDAAADREELPPVAGVCRVCGAPAYNERATFCEAHRYKGPG